MSTGHPGEVDFDRLRVDPRELPWNLKPGDKSMCKRCDRMVYLDVVEVRDGLALHWWVARGAAEQWQIECPRSNRKDGRHEPWRRGDTRGHANRAA